VVELPLQPKTLQVEKNLSKRINKQFKIESRPALSTALKEAIAQLSLQ
jgi:hypothetical protein